MTELDANLYRSLPTSSWFWAKPLSSSVKLKPVPTLKIEKKKTHLLTFEEHWVRNVYFLFGTFQKMHLDVQKEIHTGLSMYKTE